MLYIGTIIGAGFATGKEIILFFGNQSVYIAAIAGVCLGLVCGLFLKLGKLKSEAQVTNGRLAFFVKIVNVALEGLVFVCACISFYCMCCGAEYIMFECFDIKYCGLILGVIVAIMSVFDLKFAKTLNFIIIPVIMILIATLLINCNFDVSGKTNILRSLKYCCMNLLMGGYIVCEQGSVMSNRQIVYTSLICAAVFAFLMVAVYFVARQFPMSAMPTFSFAKSLHIEYVAGLIILFSIFTTMLSCGNVIYNDISCFYDKKWLSICVLAAMSIVSFDWDFAQAVDKLYPLISYAGIVYFVIVSTEISFYQSKQQPLFTEKNIAKNKK